MPERQILLVDDDPIQNVLITAMLRRMTSARVASADDGLQARRFMTSFRDDLALVICDLNMPTLDGVELMQEFADQKLQVPILIVTGAPEIIVRTAAAIAIANGLNLIGTLRKPLTPASLASAVKPVLDSLVPGRDSLKFAHA